MAQAMKVVAESRDKKGTSNVRRIRRSGGLPGIVYGEGGVSMIQLNEHEFNKALRSHASEHLIMDLEIAGQGTKKVLLQEVQHHALTGKIVHVDFHEISMTKKLRVEIPLRLVGEPHGVTQQGGVLEYLVRSIEIECLPGDILEHVDVDVSALQIGHGLSVGDIKLDAAKYTIITGKEIAIAAVSAPREEEAAATPAEGAAAEPEVLREKKVEGEEGAAEAAGGKDAKAKDAAKPKESAAKPKEGAKEAKK